jgi:archaellum component FlaC
MDNEFNSMLLGILQLLKEIRDSVKDIKEIKDAVTKDIKVTIMSDDEIDFPGLE